MATAPVASPRLSVRLFKTIGRKTVDGQTSVSARYEMKDEYIDLTPFLDDASIVRTSKSVREPAGAFNITFADKPQGSFGASAPFVSGGVLESVYGLIEPMDMIEIRFWHGLGPAPARYPIAMRGFVSEVQRGQGVDDAGRPQRHVIVSGHDYGKIWQMFQIIYLAAYAEGQALLTNFSLWEMFGVEAVNAMPASEFVRKMIDKVINPHLDGFLPKNTPMPRQLLTDDLLVAHGVVNNSYQQMQGSISDILRFHGDVGVWNELYTEDREDGVHVVYRPTPALHLTQPDGADSRKIQDDAPDPVYVEIPASQVLSLSESRTDANVANFFWVNNSRFDLIDEMQRKLASIPKDDGRVSLKEYPNSAVKYYGIRPMYAQTQQAGDEVKNVTSGQDKETQEKRSTLQESWIDKRRRLMIEMNRDNVVFERGAARIKGGPMRDDLVELMKAGDYARFVMGRLQFEAYVVQIDHEFRPFKEFTTTLTLERSTGFVERTQMGGTGPWLLEQSSTTMGVA